MSGCIWSMMIVTQLGKYCHQMAGASCDYCDGESFIIGIL